MARRASWTCSYPNLSQMVMTHARAIFAWAYTLSLICLPIADDAGDQDSRFAKSLGFYEDAPWNLNSNPGDGKSFEVSQALKVFCCRLLSPQYIHICCCCFLQVIFEERQSFEESDDENSRGSSSALSSLTSLEELIDAVTMSEAAEKVVAHSPVSKIHRIDDS